MRLALAFCLLARSSLAFVDGAQGAASLALAPGLAAPWAGQEGGLGANPALLASLASAGLRLSYRELDARAPGELLATGAEAWMPLKQGLAAGLGWDHQGSAHLAQERLRLGLAWRAPAGLSLGAGLGLLWQRLALSMPMPGLNLERSEALAADLALGATWQAHEWLALGAAAEQLGAPNLGISADERLDPAWRASLSLGPEALQALAGIESRDAGGPLWGAGLRWAPWPALELRAGWRDTALSAGFKVAQSAWSLSYTFQNPLGAAAGRSVPTHSLELGWQFEDAREKRRELVSQQAAANRLRAGRFVAAAARAEGAGDAYAARQRYEWALQLDPEHAAAREGLARLRAAQPQGALADARALKALDQAALARAQGRPEQALTLLDEPLARFPTDRVLLLAAQDARQQLRSRQAAAQAAPRPSPEPKASSADVQRRLDEADALAARGLKDLASKLLDEAEALDPGNAEVAKRRRAAAKPGVDAPARRRSRRLMEEGLNAYLDGKLDEAIRLLEQAVQADPENAEALNNLTRARVEKENP